MGSPFTRSRFIVGLVIGLAAGFALGSLWFSGTDAATDSGVRTTERPDPSPKEGSAASTPRLERIAASESPADPTDAASTAVSNLAGERSEVGDTAGIVPDSEIRGRLLSRDGLPVVGARVFAVKASILAGQPEAQFAQESRASPEDDGAVARTREAGRFGLFGLVAGVEYVLFADVRRDDPFVRLAGPARIGVAIAPAADLDFVDASRWLHLAFELDAELNALAERDPKAQVTAQIAYGNDRRSRSSTWTSFPLRSRPTLRVATEAKIEFSFSGEGIAPVDLDAVFLEQEEFERTSIVPLRGWGEGNRVRVVVEDETGARLDRAAISILPGQDVAPPPWASAPAATEARLEASESGEFVKTNVRPGPVTIIVAAPLALELAFSSATIEVPEHGEVLHVARLVRGGSVIVRVTEAALPMRAIEIVRDAAGDPSAHVGFVDPSGSLSTGVVVPIEPRDFRNGHAIAPGDYAVKWLRKPARVERKPFRIVAGETTTVTIP